MISRIMTNTMINTIRSLALLGAIILLTPTVSQAATVLVGDKISVEADEVIENDYYVSVGTLGTTYMSGEVQGDMYAFGGSVTANGLIDGDFGSVGGLSFMHASVTDDVRIVAGEAVIDHHVGGDVFVFGGVLKILSTAQVDGDVIFYGMEGEIAGDVGGSVYGTANRLRLDGPVGGVVDVDVTGELTLGSNADIAGDVRYRGFNELVRAQDSVVEGEITKQSPPTDAEAWNWQAALVPLFISLFATLTLYLLFKREIEVVVRTMLSSPLPAGLIGLATVVTGPFISLLLISTVLGMLLGVFGIGAVLVLVALGFVFAIVFLGALIAKLSSGKPRVSLPWILLGAVTFHACLLLPLIGILVAFVLVSMAVGAVLLTLYRAAR